LLSSIIAGKTNGSILPPAAEWFANIDNPNTRRAYRNDLQGVHGFVGITTPGGIPAGHACVEVDNPSRMGLGSFDKARVVVRGM
jgi:hypothetical protein